MGRTGGYEQHLEAPAGDVFAVVTDPGRLTEWNRRIRRVVERPAVLAPGAEWVVELRILGQSFRSRSHVLELDAERGLLRHRSNPEGDPDFSDWTWSVTPEGDGCRVRVSWELHPVLLVNRAVWVHIRRRQLEREVPASLTVLERLVRDRVGRTARSEAR